MIVFSIWDGVGKNWGISHMNGSREEYEQSVRDMLACVDADDVYSLIIYKNVSFFMYTYI